MSDTDVQTVMNLASCSEEVAKQSLLETNSIVDAVCKIMEIPPVSQRKLTPEQEFFKKMRLDMEAMDKDITKKISQRDEPCRSQVSLQDGTSIVSENTLKNQIEVPVLEEQNRELLIRHRLNALAIRSRMAELHLVLIWYVLHRTLP